MNKLSIELLDSIKLPLVTRLYKTYYPAGKAKKNEQIIVGYLEKELVSVVRLRSIENVRLLTGMLVIPSLQKQGLGHELLSFCQRYYLQETDYCFAYQPLANFYHQHGFHMIDAKTLPSSLAALFQRYLVSGKNLIGMQYQSN